MTRLDHDTLIRVLPNPSGSPDWDDVLRRSSSRGGHRRLVGLAGAALILALGTAAAFGSVRDLFFDSAGQVVGSATWSPDGRRIAYVVDDLPNQLVEVSIMNADGSGRRVLARERWLQVAPVWSPDSQRIALLTNPCARAKAARACATEITVAEADGSGRRRLARGGSATRNSAGQPEPGGDGFAWSPDGRRIAFVSNRGGAYELYVMNADGTRQRRLTRNRTTELDPVWSPNGKKIAFFTTTFNRPPRRPEIVVVNADGTGLRVLARGDSPSWSPDGRRIAFVHETPYLNREIQIMNADGTNQRRLTRKAGSEDAPTWSPDGRQIVFARIGTQTGNREIALIGADGSGQRVLSRDSQRHANPEWSPDGRMILFVADGDVYVVNRDGSHRRNLTQSGT